MILHPRYTRPALRDLWDRPEALYESWFEVEMAVQEARAELGKINPEIPAAMRKASAIQVWRIEEIEATGDHDMIAFVTQQREVFLSAGMPLAWANTLHEETTSYDIEDPATVLRLRRAFEFILEELQALYESLRRRAFEFQWTVQMGRTHGQFAEPTVFGHMLLVYAENVYRAIGRVQRCLQFELSEGKISGAVGNYVDVDPEIEALALRKIGLIPALAETQILQRDRHAMCLTTLAVVAGSIEQMARTFQTWARSEIREVQEPRKPGQKGSSAMPQKRNPIKLEQLFGLPRLVYADALVALLNIGTLEGREISQSSTERHILPRSTALTHYMAWQMRRVIDGLQVNTDRMTMTIESTRGTWAAHRVRNLIMEVAKISPEIAYDIVRDASFKAVEEGRHLMDVLTEVRLPEVNEPLVALVGEGRVRALFNINAYIQKGIEHLFVRYAEERGR